MLLNLAIILVVALDICAIVVWSQNEGTKKMIESRNTAREGSVRQPEIIPYGATVSLADVLGGRDKALETPRYFQYIVFQFFSPESRRHQDILTWTDILASEYHHQFIFLAIARGRADWLFRKGFRLKFVKVIEDTDLGIGRMFKVPGHRDATIVVDSAGKVVFVTSSLASGDLLRQLVLKLATK